MHKGGDERCFAVPMISAIGRVYTRPEGPIHPNKKCDCSDQLVEGSGGASLTAKASRTSDKFQDGASANERCSGLNFRGNVAR